MKRCSTKIKKIVGDAKQTLEIQVESTLISFFESWLLYRQDFSKTDQGRRKAD